MKLDLNVHAKLDLYIDHSMGFSLLSLFVMKE